MKYLLGTLDFLKPTSDAAHIEKTIDLLQSLHEEDSPQYPDETAENYISKIFPNPVSGQLTVNYYSSSASAAAFQLSDANGRTNKTITTPQMHKGKNTFNLNTGFLKPGLYYISLKCRGQNTSTHKIVVME